MPWLRFYLAHSEAHVSGRHLNALLNAEDAAGITLEEDCVAMRTRGRLSSPMADLCHCCSTAIGSGVNWPASCLTMCDRASTRCMPWRTSAVMRSSRWRALARILCSSTLSTDEAVPHGNPRAWELLDWNRSQVTSLGELPSSSLNDGTASSPLWLPVSILSTIIGACTTPLCSIRLSGCVPQRKRSARSGSYYEANWTLNPDDDSPLRGSLVEQCDELRIPLWRGLHARWQGFSDCCHK